MAVDLTRKLNDVCVGEPSGIRLDANELERRLDEVQVAAGRAVGQMRISLEGSPHPPSAPPVVLLLADAYPAHYRPDHERTAMSFRHSVPTLVPVTPFVWLLACSEAPELVSDGADLEEVPAVASVEWAVGAADGDPDYVFGSVSRGLALDGAGRLYVPDGLSNQIRVYGSDGTFVRAFGRPGDGPGDMRQPCCLAFDSRGRIWVWNDADLEQHLRYDVFETDPPRHSFRIPGGTLYTSSATHTLPTSEGGLVHVAMNRERATPPVWLQLPGLGMQRLPPIGEEWIRKWRLIADSTGNELTRVPVPSAPPDSLSLLRKEMEGVVYWLVVPGSATTLDAHTAEAFARAVSSRYRIKWHDATGALLRTLERPVEGPLLTPEERDELAAAHRREQEAARSRGAELEDVPIPERKHPLERLFFDLDGRLWVQRAVAAGDSLNMADVYAPDGVYLHTVRWPASVRLGRGAIRGDVAYGVSLDELDVARVVKLRIGRMD